MAFQDKTDYFGLATDSSGLVLTSSTENKSATVITAQDEKGDVVAEEIVGQTSAPSCTYVVKKDATLTGQKLGSAAGGYVISNISITTGAGNPPGITVTGESVPASTHTDCYYDTPSCTVEVCHHAQILFSAFTLTGAGCHLTSANYTISGSLTKATKDGETIAYDISDGKIEVQVEIVQTGTAAPTLTPGDGFTITSPMTKTEGDAAYPTWSATLTKHLVHHAAA